MPDVTEPTERDEDWGVLIETLRTVGGVREEDGRVVVRRPEPDDGSREIVIVMTPGDWTEMFCIMWGASESAPAAEYVARLIHELGPEHDFLVYEKYDLHASESPVLPPDEGLVALQEYQRQHPEAVGNMGWYAFPPTSADDRR
jgi:hypothetical protein